MHLIEIHSNNAAENSALPQRDTLHLKYIQIENSYFKL